MDNNSYHDRYNMLDFRRFYPLLIVGVLGASVGAVERTTDKKNTLSLSLEEFTRLAIKNSLRSKIAEDSFISSKYGWTAARRNLTWPSLTASANKTKSISEDDLGSQTDTRTDSSELSLSQPFLSGTNLSLAGTWTDTKSTLESVGISTDTFTHTRPSFSARITQPLYLFTGNRSWRSKKTSDLQWGNDQDSFRGEMLSIEFDARTRYYNLVLQEQTTEVERKKLESAQLVNNVTRALVRAGKLAEVESVRADIRSKRDIRRIQNSESALKKSMNEAKDFLSLPVETEIRLTTPLRYHPFRVSLEVLTEAAISHNPDLLSAQRQIRLSEIQLKNTREADNPNLSASGSYERTRNRSNSLLPLDPYTWSIGLGVEWALFDATQTRLQTRQAEITLENSKRSFENQLRQLKVDLENAYLEIKRVEEQISDFEPQRISAQRNVTAIRLQYRNGLTRLTDVFDAENELRDLELEYLGLLVNFNTSVDNLKVLIGQTLPEQAEGKR